MVFLKRCSHCLGFAFVSSRTAVNYVRRPARACAAQEKHVAPGPSQAMRTTLWRLIFLVLNSGRSGICRLTRRGEVKLYHRRQIAWFLGLFAYYFLSYLSWIKSQNALALAQGQSQKHPTQGPRSPDSKNNWYNSEEEGSGRWTILGLKLPAEYWKITWRLACLVWHEALGVNDYTFSIV